MRAQQEQEMLCRRLAEEARGRGQAREKADFERWAQDYEDGAELIRQLLARGGGHNEGSLEAGLGP